MTENQKIAVIAGLAAGAVGLMYRRIRRTEKLVVEYCDKGLACLETVEKMLIDETFDEIVSRIEDE